MPAHSARRYPLKVCLVRLHAAGAARKHYRLIDWSAPTQARYASRSEGSGESTAEAIHAAVAAWRDDHCRYPDGEITWAVHPPGLDAPLQGHFPTDAGTFWDHLGHALAEAGLAAGLLGLALAPVPGSRVAAAALWAGATASSAAAALINLAQDAEDGFSDLRRVGFDVLNLATCALGGAWALGARITLETGDGVQTLSLLGRVGRAGTLGTLAVQGVLMTEVVRERYHAILDDPHLTPKARTDQLIRLFGEAAGAGALTALSLRGTPLDGETLDPATAEALADPGARLDFSTPPKPEIALPAEQDEITATVQTAPEYGAGLDHAAETERTLIPSDMPLTQEQIDEIRQLPKGQRPDPSEYLSTEYIESHRKLFRDGATRFMTRSNLDKYGIGQRDGTAFVLPKAKADEILSLTKHDPRALEQALGLPLDFLDSNSLVRIDLPEPLQLNVRIPSGNEAGANEFWLPGGRLPNGNPEGVLDVGNTPESKYTWHTVESGRAEK